MKKLLLVIGLFSVILTNLKAQEIKEELTPVRKNRIEGGINFSNHLGIVDDVLVRFDVGEGFNLGFYREHQFTRNFYLLYGAGFRMSTFKGQLVEPYATKAIYKERVRESSIVIPIRAGYRFEFKKKSAFEIEYGLYYGRILSSRLEILKSPPQLIRKNIPRDLLDAKVRKANEFGFSGRMAYVYNDRWLIFMATNNSLTNTIDFLNPDQICHITGTEFVLGLGLKF